MKDLQDNQLFELIQQSSHPAFNELYKRHWKYIYSIAYRKIQDKDDSFDLTQSVFMEFYDKREQLVVNIPLKNFLRTAILYKLSNYFRTRGLQEKHYLNFQQFLTQAAESSPFTDTLEAKENELEFEQMVELIYQTIEDMPEKMKEVFMMSRTEKYSINEIAEQLNLSPQTIKNQISKAFSRIRTVAAAYKMSTAQMMILIWLTHP